MKIDNIDNYWACKICDVLTEKITLSHQQTAHCPQCGHILSHKIDLSVEKNLALSLTSLLLFFPAISLPLMSLEVLGIRQEQTLINSLISVYSDKQMVMAFIILMGCIVLPLMKIVSLFYVSFSIFYNLHLPKSGLIFRIYHEIEEWSMLEIFLLAIIVSVIKLRIYDTLEFEPGLIFFSLLLVMTLMSSNLLDKEYYWQQIEKLKNHV